MLMLRRFALLLILSGLAVPATLFAHQTIATYYTGDVPVSDIPVEHLDVINYAFASANDALLCQKPTDKQKKRFAQLRALRDAHPGLQLIISIGGWAAVPQFSDIALTKKSRTAFAESCIQYFVTGQGFDGIDLDWEFPVTGGVNKSRPSDRKNFTALAQQFRRQLDQLGAKNHRHYLLTAATPAARYEADGAYVVTDSYNLAALAPVLDWFNVMTYDFGTAFSPVSDFNAPLDGKGENNIKAAIQLYASHDVALDKIMLGVPFYARGFVGVSSKQAGLHSSYDKTFAYTTWEKVKDQLLTSADWTRHWSALAQAPWLYNAKKNAFLSYEDPVSIGIRAHYAQKNKLRGVMIWALGGDDAQYSLLQSIDAHLNR